MQAWLHAGVQETGLGEAEEAQEQEEEDEGAVEENSPGKGVIENHHNQKAKMMWVVKITKHKFQMPATTKCQRVSKEPKLLQDACTELIQY